MSDPNQVQFAPFIAINQFMLPEYRQVVIETVFRHVANLLPARRTAINHLVQRYVKIAGFRNSGLAPLPIRIRQSQSVFERHSDFVAQILEGWSELQPLLKKQIYDLLQDRGWEILPIETDRTKLPGFMVRWPAQETYEALGTAFTLKFPESATNENDLRLMVVWLSSRLPFDMVEKDGE